MPPLRPIKRKLPQLEWREEHVELPSSTSSSLTIESVPTTPSSVEINNPGRIDQLTQLICALTSNIQTGQTREISVMGRESIPTFDPEDKSTSVGRWLTKVEELRQIHGWSDVATASFALNKLRGYAKTWYDRLPSINLTWPEWKVKLLLSFPEETDYSELLNKMIKRTKLSNESIVCYYYDKLALLNMCKITGKDAVSCIIAGIPENFIQMSAKSGKYQSPEELLIFLKTIDYNTVDIRNKFTGNKRVGEISTLRGNSQHKRQRYEPRSNMDRRLCYGCGSRDHLLHECKVKRRCAKCNQYHSGKCGASSQPQLIKPQLKEVMKLQEAETTSKKFFLDIFVNNVKIKAFVDMGAECNTMTENTFKLLKLPLIEEFIKIKGFGGGLTTSLGVIKNVKVEIDEVKTFSDFVIVENSIQNVPVIIGHPLTEQEGVCIFKDSKRLRILNSNLRELPSVIESQDEKVPLWVKQTTVIPPKHFANVLCKTQIHGNFLINSSARLKENNEYLVLRCIVSSDQNKECTVPVMNPTETEVVIKPNKIFARGEKCMLENDEMLSTWDETDIIDFKNLRIGTTLTEEEKEKLLKLLNEHKDSFATSLDRLGCTSAAELEIDLLDEKPITYKPYRMSPTDRSKVKEIVDDLLKHEIIRESTSPFASPILLVKKKNGEQRLCVDYRKLNEKIKQDKFPLPRIDDQLDQLGGYNYFTTLDMRSGYYQVPVKETSKFKTSFITPDGQYEFNRMPFGISTAPSLFQRMMNKILGPLRGTEAIVYLDDILIPSKNFDEGINRLRNVLNSLSENKLTLNPEKCCFFETSITYLGFEIDNNGLKPGLSKTECVRDFPTPKNIHQVRQFLGLTGFFRQFVKDYALLCKPLTDLLKKDQKWLWEESQEKAFQKLKEILTRRPVLAIYNPQAETEVHTDASKNGVAGILMQKDANSKLHAVAYYSRKTTPAEEKYHSYELETLAVVESLKKFRVYLLGIQFKVITDCSAVTAAAKKKDLVPRIARWWLTLQEFTFQIEHRPGTKMSHVDALSRNFADNDNNEVQILTIEVADWVLAGQLTDERVQNIHEVLKRKPTSDYEKNIHKEYKIENGRIYKVTEKGLKWLVPKGMRNEIVRGCHDEFGHFALEKTLKRISESYWFPNMRNYIQRYINSCIRCLYYKHPAGKRPGYLNSIEKNKTPFDTIHLDHLGPFIRSTSGNKHLIVCVEAFTKYTLLQAVRDTKTQPVIRFLNQIISLFGVPRRMITDKGSCYTSKAFRAFCQEKGIKHVQNAVATPRANGQVERVNSTALASLSTTAKEDRKWDKELGKIQLAINSSIHSVTQKTPSELLYGYTPRAPADSFLVNEVRREENSPTTIHTKREEAFRRIQESQQK